MSIKALNWATEIYVGDGHAKSLLRAIANYADENGHCFPSLNQLSADTEFSVDTCRRRIGWLEERGLLTTFACWMDEKGIRNRDRRGRETTKEIRLAVGKHPVRPTEIDGENAVGEGDQGVAGSHPQDVVEGSPPARDGVPPARAGVAVQPPPSEPSSNLKIPPSPPRRGERGADASNEESEPEHFVEFWAAYPNSEVGRRSKALEKFRGMSPAERAHARAAAPLYAERLRKLDRKPLGAHIWLNEKGWLEFAAAVPVVATAQQPAPTFVLVNPNSAEGKAITTLCRMARASLPFATRDGNFNYRGEITPQLLAMADAPPLDQWKRIEDRQQLGAWGSFVSRYITTPRPPLAQQGESGPWLMAPWDWPPRKDGTFSDAE